MRAWIVVVAVYACAACPAARGGYVQGARSAERDRGETQGRVFDFVSNKPDGDDWQLRLRGSSLWASYSHGAESDELPSRNLTPKETARVWELIDALDIPARKKGRKDHDAGYVYMRLREPGAQDDYDLFEIYVSRDTEDERVIELAEHLRGLIEKYHRETPNF